MAIIQIKTVLLLTLTACCFFITSCQKERRIENDLFPHTIRSLGTKNIKLEQKLSQCLQDCTVTVDKELSQELLSLLKSHRKDFLTSLQNSLKTAEKVFAKNSTGAIGVFEGLTIFLNNGRISSSEFDAVTGFRDEWVQWMTSNELNKFAEVQHLYGIYFAEKTNWEESIQYFKKCANEGPKKDQCRSGHAKAVAEFESFGCFHQKDIQHGILFSIASMKKNPPNKFKYSGEKILNPTPVISFEDIISIRYEQVESRDGAVFELNTVGQESLMQKSKDQKGKWLVISLEKSPLLTLPLDSNEAIDTKYITVPINEIGKKDFFPKVCKVYQRTLPERLKLNK